MEHGPWLFREWAPHDGFPYALYVELKFMPICILWQWINEISWLQHIMIFCRKIRYSLVGFSISWILRLIALLGVSRITCLDTHRKAPNNRGGVAELKRKTNRHNFTQALLGIIILNSTWSIGKKRSFLHVLWFDQFLSHLWRAMLHLSLFVGT
jgi:hypothetical protein